MPVAPTPAVDRVMARVVVHPLGCWEFTGALSNGYGMVQLGRGIGTDRTHRVVYEDMVGPIPEGATLDHLCLNTTCCNPTHLQPVSRSENTSRQWAAGRGNAGSVERAKTHCKRGHAFDEANTRTWKTHRTCRACHAAYMRNYKPKERTCAQ